MFKAIRGFFDSQGFVEVHTPQLLKTVATEEHIEPVQAGDRFLATSPELEMKLLVASGLSPIYQIARSHRQGERGSRHQPEFAILEWYRPGNTLDPLVEDLQNLFAAISQAVKGSTQFFWQQRPIDFGASFPRTSVQEAFLNEAHWDPLTPPLDPLKFDMDLVEKVEPTLGKGGPEVLERYPAPLGSLARLAPEDPRVALRLELYVEGIELANGFVELNDPEQQRQRFIEASEAIVKLGRTPPPLPESYLEALPNLPDTVGIAVGVDRLVMLLADAADIADVVAFEHLEA